MKKVRVSVFQQLMMTFDLEVPEDVGHPRVEAGAALVEQLNAALEAMPGHRKHTVIAQTIHVVDGDAHDPK